MLGLRAPLISSGGVPASTALEASWLYTDAIDELGDLPRRPTVASKLCTLARATELLVGATQGRCDELSADDLVPLLTLALVGGSGLDVAFEGYVLDELLPDLIATGRESYCVCTLQVALGFLRQVDVAPRAQPDGEGGGEAIDAPARRSGADLNWSSTPRASWA